MASSPGEPNAASGESIADAYQDAVREYRYREHLLIQVENPVQSMSHVPGDRSNWDLGVARNVLRFGRIDAAFLNRDLDGGSTVLDWIERDITSYTSGHAYRRLTGASEPWSMDQLCRVIEHLTSDPVPGPDSNKLVCQIFHPDEIPRDTSVENVNDCNCNTTIQFKPVNSGSTLHLYATFRSQYIDSRAFGNLVGLSSLLAQVCNTVDHKPGRLINVTNNATVESGQDIDWIRGIL